MKNVLNKWKISIVFFIFSALCAKVLDARLYDIKTKLNLSSFKNSVNASSPTNYY